MKKLRWTAIGLRLNWWWDLLVCEFTGHDPRLRTKFDGHGGIWQQVECDRCGGVVSG